MIDAEHPPIPAVRDCIFAFEVLRRIGFDSKDIYAATGNFVGDGRCSCVVLRTAGVEWKWIIAQIDISDAEFLRLWEETGEAWNRMPPNGDPWGFHGSHIDAMGAVAVSSIVAKGIAIPVRRSCAN